MVFFFCYIKITNVLEKIFYDSSMATPSTAFQLSGLALRLVRTDILSRDNAEQLQQKAIQKGRSFFTQVARNNTIPTEQLSWAASEEFGLPLLDISAIDLEQAPVELVADGLIEKHNVLPLYKRGTKLFLAIADPTDRRALEDVKFHTGLGIEPILVSHDQLLAAIEQAREANDSTYSDLVGDEEGLEDIDISSEDEASKGDEGIVEQIDTPIVRFVNKMLLDAIKKSASDIHIEPYEKKLRVRFRVDGVLHELASPPVNLAARVCARVKILSRLDIAERRVPQDGRMKLNLSRNRSIDFRVSTLPTLYGEKTVIRLLDASGASLGLENLGFEPFQQEHYIEAIKRPYGMILVTGPTGSGKTVTLYTALNMLNVPERNICTVEDPVEINVAGINQVNINERANLTFASALRAFLRQDPDVIMVGEIRDLETADIAIKASQTGHLVLSTLHTNDAPSTLTRLLNMGVAPFNIASAVHLILAQRLVRRLCESCKKPLEIPEKALLAAGFEEDDIHDLQMFGPVGCNGCTEGYRGRAAVFQVMPISEPMGNLIMEGCTEHDIDNMAKMEGAVGLRQAGILKVKQGITSLEEVERVTNL
jgi:type IV pilus assembly protein PilB